jgi:hypothetical protein
MPVFGSLRGYLIEADAKVMTENEFLRLPRFTVRRIAGAKHA